MYNSWEFGPVQGTNQFSATPLQLVLGNTIRIGDTKYHVQCSSPHDPAYLVQEEVRRLSGQPARAAHQQSWRTHASSPTGTAMFWVPNFTFHSQASNSWGDH